MQTYTHKEDSTVEALGLWGWQIKMSLEYKLLTNTNMSQLLYLPKPRTRKQSLRY